MKKWMKVLSMLLICFSLSQSLVFASRDDLLDRPIIIGGDEYFPPFEYVDTNGVYKGFNIDIMHAIAIEMGLDIETHPLTWKIATESLEMGSIDVIQGMKYTVERQKVFSFSEPYLESSLSIFISKDNDYIKSLADLENQIVAVQENDVANDVVRSIPNVQIYKAKSQLNALEYLIDGDAVAYVGNRQTGLYSIQKYKHSEDVMVIGSPINPQSYGLAVKRGNEDLLKIFDEGLAIIKRNGTYDKIHDKWFGEEIYSTREVLRNYIYIFLIVVAVLGVIAFINLRMNHLLKAEVNRQIHEVKQSNLFKEHIINSIFSGLITFNTSGIVLSVNKNVSEICRQDAETFVGKALEEISFKNFIDDTLFHKALKTGERFINHESTVTLGDNARIIEYNIYPIKDLENVIQGITVTFLDITTRKRNAEQIQRKDKLESLGRLTANIAHEIRNPLTAIKTYIELIPKKIHSQAFQEQIAKDVPQVIERLNGLITELLEYAKPRVSNKAVFLLNKPITEVMSLIEGELNRHSILLETQLVPDCYVQLDSQHLKQILLNLLINSIEAVKEVPQPIIAVRSYITGEHIIVEVDDNGVGISHQDLEIIFEPFYTKRTEGTGLGLSIAQQLAEENDGLLTAESELGVGTIMRLHLPFQRQTTLEERQ